MKMITVSLIQEYYYCPLSVYIHLKNSEILTNSMIAGKISHKAIIGFEEIIKRNLWGLKGNLDIKEILNELYKDVPEYIDSIYRRYKEETIDSNFLVRFESLKEDLRFNSWILAIKSQQMLKNGIIGSEAVDILFPPCLSEFKIENKEIGLIGKIDKIVIADGVYYPIKIKTNLPPLKGVWESDAIQVAAYAFLMEQEFNKEIPVGFINYIKIGSKKTVLINTSLREKFTNIFNGLSSTLYNDKEPEAIQNINKCRACEYSDLCDYSLSDIN
jgi:CRISPR-associated exonuclease Cas4